MFLDEDEGEGFSSHLFSLVDQQMCFPGKYWLPCFADFGRDLGSAQNQIVFQGFLFCDIFVSRKYFQLFIICF